MEQIGNMTLELINQVGILRFRDWENLDFINHAFSTRLGGVSENEFSSMNFSFGRGDSSENVLENYRRFCQAANFPYENLVSSSQVHKTVIRRVGKQNGGCGIWKPQEALGVDGLCTNEPGVVLVTHYADCTPLYFVDPVKKCIGAAHAGWRGTVAQIGRIMVERLQSEFGSNPGDILAAIGPSIGKECYEVDDAVATQAKKLPIDVEAVLTPKENGKYWFDLWECNRRIIHSAGVPFENITVGGVCTMCHPELLFSHRYTAGKRGGMAAFLMLVQ